MEDIVIEINLVLFKVQPVTVVYGETLKIAE